MMDAERHMQRHDGDCGFWRRSAPLRGDFKFAPNLSEIPSPKSATELTRTVGLVLQLAPSGQLICNRDIRLSPPGDRDQNATRKVTYEINQGFACRSGFGWHSGDCAHRCIRSRWGWRRRMRRSRWRRRWLWWWPRRRVWWWWRPFWRWGLWWWGPFRRGRQPF